MNAPSPEQDAVCAFIAAAAAHAVKKSAAPAPESAGSLSRSREQQAAADHEDAVNRYADSKIRADKLHANDGRPEHDFYIGGRRL